MKKLKSKNITHTNVLPGIYCTYKEVLIRVYIKCGIWKWVLITDPIIEGSTTSKTSEIALKNAEQFINAQNAKNSK